MLKAKTKAQASLMENKQNTKVMFLGDSWVGKSSLLIRFHRNEFSEGIGVNPGGSFLQTKVEFEKEHY